MAKTALDVVCKAMRRIGYISPEETPDPTDYNEALEEYEGFHEWLLKEFPRQIHWNNDSVPVEYWTHVAGWFGGRLTNVLKVSPEHKMNAKEGASESERYLREMLSRKSIKVTTADYF